jgi:hypothetical protein
MLSLNFFVETLHHYQVSYVGNLIIPSMALMAMIGAVFRFMEFFVYPSFQHNMLYFLTMYYPVCQ